MRSGQAVTAALFAFFGLAFTAGSFSLGVGGILQPGPGFFPLLVGSILVFLSVLTLIGDIRRTSPKPLGTPPEGSGGAEKRRHYSDVLVTSVCLILFTVAIEPLGFLASMFCLVVFLVGGMGRKSWKAAILYSLVAVLFVHIVFERWLMIQLPLGVMEFLLG
ncbi:MAG: tripartite tricarboxylate transporter TctB family protein [Deltaproteobacteria bacterium]|nr:tripartite tricarboxylate transporter TctB family protein [Deltaproteobacteria bacterium]